MKVIKIPYDKKIPCTVHEIAEASDQPLEQYGRVLKDIKKLIGIDWAEIVVLRLLKNEDPQRDYCLIVDEIGKLKDVRHERFNFRASQFYPGTFYGDPIVGDVVLCARQWTDGYGECDLAGLTDKEEAILMFELS